MKQAILVIVILGCCILYADNLPDSLKTFYLPTIRVIVGKNSEAIGSITQIHNEEFASKTTIQEAMLNTPGISATSGSKDESNLRLRGFRKNEVKILVDGRPLNNGYFGNVDISKLALLNIAEIQIVKGPASPLYGSNSMGGVLNIITKAPNRREWLNLGLGILRNNTQNLSLSSAHSFSGWDYNLSIAAENSDGFVLSKDFTPTYSENGGVRNCSAKTQYNLRAGLGLELLNFHKITADFSYSGMAKKNIPSSIYESKYRRFEDWMRYNASVNGQFNLNEHLVLHALIANDAAADRYLEFNDPAYTTLSVDSRMENRSWSFGPRLKWQLNETKSIDIGYRYELQTNRRKDKGEYPEWTNNSIILHSAFGQYEHQLNSSFRITSAIGAASGMNDLEPKVSFIPEPALGLIWEGKKGDSSSLALGLSSAQPTMRQLFSSSKGNPSLKPQYAYKAEISHLQPVVANALSINASIYYNDTRRLIDLYHGRYENIFRVRSYGLEAGVKFSPFKSYELTADYAWLDYQKNSDYRLTETPKHAIEISHQLLLPFFAKLQFGSSYRYKRISQDEIGGYHTLVPYWTHDLGLLVPWRKLNVSTKLQNILDANYQEEYGFPAQGRNYTFSLQLKL